MNASPFANWTRVGALSDIPRRGARCIKGAGIAIAVFRTADDRVYAMEDRCPHRDGPLSQGIVHDASVTCPLHNWVIGLATGEALGPDTGSVRTLPVRLDGEDIYIDATDLDVAGLRGAA